MAQAEDPEKYYIEVIMQEKLKLYLEYVRSHSFCGDIKLIFKTFWVILAKRVHRATPSMSFLSC